MICPSILHDLAQVRVIRVNFKRTYYIQRVFMINTLTCCLSWGERGSEKRGLHYLTCIEWELNKFPQNHFNLWFKTLIGIGSQFPDSLGPFNDVWSLFFTLGKLPRQDLLELTVRVRSPQARALGTISSVCLQPACSSLKKINYFIVVHLQLFAFTPHHSPPPQTNPPLSLASTHHLSFVYLSFIVVPENPSPPYPLPPPLWLLSDCS